MNGEMSELSIRIADINDAHQLLEWRNDPGTHRWYKNPTPVREHEHLTWLGSELSRNPITMWMAEHSAQPSGSVRLSEPVDGVATVSVVVAPKARGQGIASALLAYVEREAMSLGYLELVAEIHEGNEESRSLFEKAGYSLHSTDTFLMYRKTVEG